MGTSVPATSKDDGLDRDSILDWVNRNSRMLTYVAGGAAIVVAVALFWRESIQRKNERAEAALATAQSAFYSGNTALAKSDLEKLTARYPGTVGGTQASILLAQILYGEGKHDDGINRLNSAAGSAPAQLGAAVEELIAAGYADTKRYDQAVEHLNKAADKSAFPAEKAIYHAEAARIMQIAGKNAEARKIWEALISDPDSPVASEARVRVGEIDARAAAK